MRKKNPSPLKSLLPRGKRARRRVELLGGAAVGLTALLVISVFLASSLDKYLLGSSQYASVIAAVLIDLANGDRTAESLGTLTINPKLVAAAQAKADDMATYSYFAHVSPQGADPWHWFEVAGYTFAYAGENLAVDFSDSSDVERAWMNSPTHRENILDPHFTEIGIAVAQGMYQGRLTTFVVQEFGAPSGADKKIASIQNQTIPSSPTQPARATTQSSPSNVLGTSAEVTQIPAPAPSLVVTTKAVAEAPDYAPWWAHLLTSPRSMLGYAYWLIGLLIVIALGIATGFEIHVHHMRKAIAAGILLSFMLVMFIAANTFVFTTPILTPQATMTAAASAAF